jgi:hypothetical protein
VGNPRLDTTSVTFPPLALDHFHVYLIQDQVADVGFPVAISARDADDLILTGFNGQATLADATGTLAPAAPIQFHNGVWNGDGQVAVDPTWLVFDTVGWHVVRQVVVTALDDAIVEGAHTSAINHTAASADVRYDGIVVAGVTVNLADNDGPPPTVSVQFDSASYCIKETAGMADIVVTLSATSTVPVTVTYATGDGTAADGHDYIAVSGTLHFDVGQVGRALTVPILGDVAIEGDEVINLALSSPVHADLGVPSEAALIIVDNVLLMPCILRDFGASSR